MRLSDFTKQWWEKKLMDGLADWLIRLRATEWDAANRFQLALDSWPANGPEKIMFEQIMQDERRHSRMVEEVLIRQCISFPEHAEVGRERYWEQVWPHVTGFRFACASLAFGETLAIARFRVIVEHPGTPSFVRELVESVIPDEERHIHQLTSIAGPAIMNYMRKFHKLGMVAINIR